MNPMTFLTLILVATPRATPEELARLRELDSRQIHQLTRIELAEYLALSTRLESLSPQERVVLFAKKSVGQPYVLHARVWDNTASDCVSFVDKTLALALAHDWASYRKLIHRLTHKDGSTGFLETNFSTLADWVPNNTWLFSDVTEDAGGHTEYQETLRRKEFYRQLEFGADDSALGRAKAELQAAKVLEVPERLVLNVKFVSRAEVETAMQFIENADIFIFVTEYRDKDETRLGSTHLGIAIRDEDDLLYVVHSKPPAVRIDLISDILSASRVRGFKLLRLRDDAYPSAMQEIERMTTYTVPNP